MAMNKISACSVAGLGLGAVVLNYIYLYEYASILSGAMVILCIWMSIQSKDKDDRLVWLEGIVLSILAYICTLLLMHWSR